MIYFKFVIDNPWHRPLDDFDSRDFFCKEGSFTRHKHWEVQISRWEPSSLFEFHLDLRWRGRDHAGPEIRMETFGLMFSAKIYDSRHWNYDKARWYFPGKDKEDDDE